MFTKPYGLRVNPKTTFKVSKLKSKFWRRFRTPFGIKPHNTCAIQTQIENDIVGGKGIQSQSEEVHEGKEATEDYKSVKRGTEHDRSLESHSDAPDLQVEAHLTLLPALAKRDVTSPNSRIGLILGTTLQLKEILGAGGNGVVYSAVDLNTSVTYAVKALSKCDANGDPLDDRAREFRVREIQLHYAASAHPNIVSLVWIIDQPDCTFLVMDYYPDGDLFTRITEKNSYLGDDMAIRTAFLQIIDAVEHCHKLGIYCRDLKPENILLNGSQLALIDFGMATTTPSSEDHGCGSSYYNSPENLDSSVDAPPYECAPSDIWALGVILVNLTCGRNPWKLASLEDPTYRAFTRDPNFLKTILPLSDELYDILVKIFEIRPDIRISILDLRAAIIRCSGFSNICIQFQGALEALDESSSGGEGGDKDEDERN